MRRVVDGRSPGKKLISSHLPLKRVGAILRGLMDFRARYLRFVLFALLSVVGSAAAVTETNSTQGFRLAASGVRGGFPANKSSDGYCQTEVFANWNLPWRWDLGRDWGLQSRIDSSIGWLGNETADGVIVNLGPSLLLNHADFPVLLETGTCSTGLSRHGYGSKNFGTSMQFTTYLGLDFEVVEQLRLGCRFQHMSNARLSSHKPGLNLIMMSVSYVF